MRETFLLKTHLKNFYKMEKDKYLLFEPGESRGNRKRETKGTKRDELFHSLGRLFKTEMYVRLNNYHNSCIPYLDNRSLYDILFFFFFYHKTGETGENFEYVLSKFYAKSEALKPLAVSAGLHAKVVEAFFLSGSSLLHVTITYSQQNSIIPHE